MKIIPILFSAPMVQAIQNGSKTQTRRIVKPKLKGNKIYFSQYYQSMVELSDGGAESKVKPKASVGDVFWVRETFQQINSYKTNQLEYIYKADGDYDDPSGYIEDWKGWKPSIFMPKDACRIFLEVIDVRLEHLQGISEYDAKEEGVLKHHITNFYKNYTSNTFDISSTRNSFFTLWELINGEKSLKENPYLWVYDFKITNKPENF